MYIAYDVFISFRGEDTRKTFTAQLHQALCKECIKTFIDYNLKKGDEVAPSLFGAICSSRISIVVFSENYATSKWCLVELTNIMECRRLYDQVVIPVFYKIDPSDVRKQTGSYETAFARYETEVTSSETYKNNVSGWKDALTQAANISGWDSRTYRDDSQLIDDIVNDVWKMLSLKNTNELKHLVQTDENKNVVETLMMKHQRVGIWGLGGMGKTTIAKQIFAKHFPRFDSVCFLENVREATEKFGVTGIRNKLLCELLRRPVTESEVVGIHTFIKRRLIDKKVFIVLDDVDDTEQLEDLCSYLDELGPDSRLIITSRDSHMLDGRVDEIYMVKKWDIRRSIELFSLGAFKTNSPSWRYWTLSERVVAHAGGIPLVLKILGSHFHFRALDFWESELNHLENNTGSLGKIEKVLKGSYDGLTAREKEIFLDIAFFFKDENKEFSIKILDACGFNAISGIKLLEEKALVTISNSSCIQMHDVLQKLAMQIVRSNCSCRERSRLCDIEEVCDVFKSSKETDKVEGILFDLSQKVELLVQVDTFTKMTELRFLRLNVPLGKTRLTTVSIPKDIKPFSDKLRYLEWNGYPLKTLPQPFCAKLLVEIRLPHSDVEHLWHGVQELVNLEGIDLSECKQLIQLPDLSRASKLKWLYLSGCESLREVKPLVFSKDTLVTLILDRCIKLQSLASISEKHLTSLKKIGVYGCSGLKVFSLSSDSIERLDLSKTGTEILHSSIGNMRKLVWLNLEGLKLKNLPNELSYLRSLTELHLSSCDVVTKSKLESVFDAKLRSLKVLYLKNCGKLLELPTNINSLSSLYELRLDGSNVRILPVSIQGLSRLEILSLDNCRKLRFLPKLPPNIKEFHADNCTSLVMVSTFKTFSESMKGENKYISFKNDMELYESSLVCITEGVILTMKNAALHNMSIEKFSMKTHSYNYDSVVVGLPGSSIPKQFEYKTTDSSSSSSSITLDITKFYYYSRGFIFGVVVSPSYGNSGYGHGAQIQCQCYMRDGRNVGVLSKWSYKAIKDLNMDHVFLWYDPYHFDSIRHFFSNVSFEFSVRTDNGEDDNFFSIKECGIYPIYLLEFPMLLDKMIIEKPIRSYLRGRIKGDIKTLESFQLRKEMESTII